MAVHARHRIESVEPLREAARAIATDAIERLLVPAAPIDVSIAVADLARAWPLLPADVRARLRERAFDAPPDVRRHARRVMSL